MAVRTWKLFTTFLCCTGFLLALSRAQEEDSVAPLTEAWVKFGHLYVVNCSSINSSSNCDIQEESSLRHNYTDVGPTWKAFTFILNNLSNWSLRALCFVNCTGSKIRHQETIIRVYQSPDSVELDPVPEMEVDKPYNLTCRVSGVAPIQNLTVTLLKGAEQLLVKTFENHAEPEASPVVVSHRIIAQQSDHNKTVTCRTSLDLRPRGPLLNNTSRSILLRIIKPLDQMILELQKPSPGQTWAYNLICHVIRVRPCHRLVVTFFKGSKRLGSPHFANCTRSEVKNYTFYHSVTLHPEDHSQKAHCHVAVHFSLHELSYQTKSSELSLKTAESYLALIVAAAAAAALLVSVLVVFLIFIVRLWMH